MNTTDLRPLPASPDIEQYRKQAKDLVKAAKSGETTLIRRIRVYHPHAGDLLDGERLKAKFALADAQLVIAREYGFESWPKFTKHLRALERDTSPVSGFERAADAIATGDAATLERLLRESPDLIRARSGRVHRAMLLHYSGANGVEHYRQKTPRNAVEIAKILLDRGAEVDAIADTYGKGATLGLVATSVHPVLAGVQIALLEALIEYGASVDGPPGTWNPLISALHNGRPDAAVFLAGRGAKLDLEGAAGVGRLDVVESFFEDDGSLKVDAGQKQMESGVMWACMYGHAAVVESLLGKGFYVTAAPNGETALHCASFGGHADIVRLFLEHEATVEMIEPTYHSTPLGWALHGWAHPGEGRGSGYYEVAALLTAAGAKVDPGWFDDPDVAEKLRNDPRMAEALAGRSESGLR